MTTVINIHHDLYFAEDDNLAVCGYGETREEAVQDLNLHIKYFSQYYKKLDSGNAIGEALRLKESYKNLS